MISSIFDIRMDRFKSNQTLKFSPFLDILRLNEGNLKKVNRCVLKFYSCEVIKGGVIERWGVEFREKMFGVNSKM